jgi:hypothetical protein
MGATFTTKVVPGGAAHGRDTLKRSSTLLLAGLTALGLACKPAPKDTTTTGGTGSESGSMNTPADTASTGTGAAIDTAVAKSDTALQKADTAMHKADTAMTK